MILLIQQNVGFAMVVLGYHDNDKPQKTPYIGGVVGLQQQLDEQTKELAFEQRENEKRRLMLKIGGVLLLLLTVIGLYFYNFTDYTPKLQQWNQERRSQQQGSKGVADAAAQFSYYNPPSTSYYYG